MKTSTSLGLATTGLAAALVVGGVASSDAAATTDVTGTETHSVARNSTYVTLTTAPTPVGDTEGAPVQWKILVGPAGQKLHTRLAATQGAGEALSWNYTFPNYLNARQIQIYKNNVLISNYTFTP